MPRRRRGEGCACCRSDAVGNARTAPNPRPAAEPCGSAPECRQPGQNDFVSDRVDELAGQPGVAGRSNGRAAVTGSTSHNAHYATLILSGAHPHRQSTGPCCGPLHGPRGPADWRPYGLGQNEMFCPLGSRPRARGSKVDATAQGGAGALRPHPLPSVAPIGKPVLPWQTVASKYSPPVRHRKTGLLI